MARKTFNVLFFIKKARLLKNGEAPVCMRITVKGCMVDVLVKRSCPVNLWNQAKENSKGKDRMSVELNHYLEITRSRIHQIYRELESTGKTITVDLMRKLYYGVDEDSKTLLQVFREHNEQSRKLIGKDFVSKTVQRYETTTRYLEEFIKKDPFAYYRFKLEETDPEFLTMDEIKIILAKEFTIKRVEQVRDVFIFCIFTGLAFSDVKDLSPEHLVKDNKGELWIRKNRQKTKIMCNIPVLPVAASILDKYKDVAECTGKLLPVLCNQRMNSYLKEIADVCGIHKNLSTHTARHSYATSVCLANGVSMENVAKMLGHADTSVTKHYARVLDQNILKDMQKVNSCLSELAI